MKIERRSDTVYVTLTPELLVELLDTDTVREAVIEKLDPGEQLDSWAIRPPQPITLVLDLDIIAAPGQSEAEIYRRENGVPLV